MGGSLGSLDAVPIAPGWDASSYGRSSGQVAPATSGVPEPMLTNKTSLRIDAIAVRDVLDVQKIAPRYSPSQGGGLAREKARITSDSRRGSS